MRRLIFDTPLVVRDWTRSCLGYALVVVTLCTVSVWSAKDVGVTVLRLLEQAVIDGSGNAAPVEEPPSAATGQQVALPATAALLTAAATEPSLPAAQAASVAQHSPINPPTDNPDRDPAAAYHDGDETTFRTFCVRLCDGYFWPVSFSTTADRFKQDESACTSSCNSPAHLFVHRMPGGGPATMVSLSGVQYAALKTAFLFRTRYDAQCTCRAQPWQQEARDRHRLFAAKDLAAKGVPGASASVQALANKLATAQELTAAASAEARATSDRELQILARTTGARLPAHILASRDARDPRQRRRDRLARVVDREQGSLMRLGGVSNANGVSRTGWSPASGNHVNWRDRVFNGN